jgi:hypothetical protein
MLWSFMLYALDPTSSLRWAARAQPIPAKPSVGNNMADGAIKHCAVLQYAMIISSHCAVLILP